MTDLEQVEQRIAAIKPTLEGRAQRKRELAALHREAALQRRRLEGLRGQRPDVAAIVDAIVGEEHRATPAEVYEAKAMLLDFEAGEIERALAESAEAA